MNFVGIDPGESGGIAVLCEEEVTFCPLDPKKVTRLDISEFLENTAPMVVVMEKVGANRVYGRAQGVSSMFTFGKNAGFLIGLLTALRIPYVEVTPAKWQKDFRLFTIKDQGPTAKKNSHKQRAQELYPNEKMTHPKADALLLATYCRRNYVSLF